LDEEVSATFVIQQKMDVILNIVDASNLERNLFLTHQLLESGLPMVIALNCMDIVRKRMEDINIPKLAERLGVPVIPITASKKQGLIDLMRQVELAVGKHRPSVLDIRPLWNRLSIASNPAWEAGFWPIVSLKTEKKGFLPLHVEPSILQDLRAIMTEETSHFSVDPDMVLPSERYDRILAICAEVMAKPIHSVGQSTDRIDKILTHRWFGLPIFGAIMFLVFYLAFGPVGHGSPMVLSDSSNVFPMDRKRHRGVGMAPWVSSLIVRGLSEGLPRWWVSCRSWSSCFCFLALLEDSGYMARAAFMMDRAMRRFGLSGKSFIPMLLGFGCSVPAVTATRTLDRPEDRRITTMVIPFVSCGAKAPIYAVFAGALFASRSYLVVFSMYLLGILVALLSAVLFKKTIMKGSSANYLMELPEYRMPTPKNVFLHTWERSKGFLVKAMTVL
jgi:ferrous iron transport protein B